MPGIARSRRGPSALRFERGSEMSRPYPSPPRLATGRLAAPGWLAPARRVPSSSRGPSAARTRRVESAITGLSYRVLGPGALQGGRIDLDADEVVDGACDDRVCFAAALVRPPVDDRSNGDGAARPRSRSRFLQFP